MTGSATRPPTKPPTKQNATNEHGELQLSPRLKARTPQGASGGISEHRFVQQASGGLGGNARRSEGSLRVAAEDGPPTDRPRATAQTAHAGMSA